MIELKLDISNSLRNSVSEIIYNVTLIDSDLSKEMTNLIEHKDICLRLNDKDDNGKLFLNGF